MPRLHMTDFAIKNLSIPPRPEKEKNSESPPVRSQEDYFDDPAARGGVRGLILRHSYGNTKTWRVMVYLNKGKSKTFRLGRYPEMTLAAARKAALDFRANAKERIKQSIPTQTFDTLADEFIAEYVNKPFGKRKTPMRTGHVVEQRINKHLRPRFKFFEFASIRRKDLAEALKDVRKAHGIAMGDAVLEIFKNMAVYYETLDEDYASPVNKKMRRYNNPDRERVLNDEEIRAFWEATGKLGTFGSMCRVLLLLGQRRQKINLLRWDDIKDGVWDIRTEPNEKPNPGRIKLPKMALDIIKAQPRFKNNPFVFAALRGRGPFNSIGQYVNQLEAAMKVILPDMEPHTLHDLRRTFRTRLAQIGIEETLAQRCIGHVVGSKNARVYNHYPFFDEMAVAFQSLADHVAGIVTPPPANVVRLTGRQRPQRALIRAAQGGSDVSTHDTPR